MSLADRVAVMYRGRIVGIIDAAEAGPEGINRDVLGLMMAGVPLEDAVQQAASHQSVLAGADAAAEDEAAAPAADERDLT